MISSLSMEKETLIAKAYDLLAFSLPMIEKFPRSHKFTLGDRLETHLLDLLEAFIEAYYLPKAKKKSVLHHINIRLEKIRYLIRLGFELKFYSSARYREWADRLHEIGRMTGGWIKSLS